VTTLASNLSNTPVAMAVDATNVYWTGAAVGQDTTGVVLMVPKAGGTVTTLASGVNPAAMVIDSTSVYFSDLTGDTLLKVPIGGGNVTTLYTLSSTNPNVPGRAGALAIQGDELYWVDGGSSRVVKLSTSGGTFTTLFTGSTTADYASIAVNATDAYWDFNSPSPIGAIKKVPLAGGTATTVATLTAEPSVLTIDANNVYWVDGNDQAPDGGEPAGAVKQVPLSGGTVVTLAVGTGLTDLTVGDPVALAVDANNVYWVNYGNGYVISAPIGGGTPTTLASPATGDESRYEPTAIAVDGTSVYWATTGNNSGSILKVTPK